MRVSSEPVPKPWYVFPGGANERRSWSSFHPSAIRLCECSESTACRSRSAWSLVAPLAKEGETKKLARRSSAACRYVASTSK